MPKVNKGEKEHLTVPYGVQIWQLLLFADLHNLIRTILPTSIEVEGERCIPTLLVHD